MSDKPTDEPNIENFDPFKHYDAEKAELVDKIHKLERVRQMFIEYSLFSTVVIIILLGLYIGVLNK